jgi:hypothetical protein
MKQKLFLSLLALLLTAVATAQESPSFAYIITAPEGTRTWNQLKRIDLSGGGPVENTYPGKAGYQTRNAVIVQPPELKNGQEGPFAGDGASPLATYSAACAFDMTQGWLYCIPLGINQLRYIGLDAKNPEGFSFAAPCTEIRMSPEFTFRESFKHQNEQCKNLIKR